MGKTYQSIIINVPVDKVWSAIRNFHDMSWAPNVITQLDIVGTKKGDEIGAGRILNGVFHETLREMEDGNYSLSYSIDDGPPPVSKSDINNYRGRLSLRPVTETNSTFVEWSSAWERNDKEAHDFCHTIYVALLGDMKKNLEA